MAIVAELPKILTNFFSWFLISLEGAQEFNWKKANFEFIFETYDKNYPKEKI